LDRWFGPNSKARTMTIASVLTSNGLSQDHPPPASNKPMSGSPAYRALARQKVFKKRPELALLELREVEAIMGCTRHLLHELEARGEFPKRIRISHRIVRYRLSDINAYLAAKQGENYVTGAAK
jgi:predicted DNA-binding transcriptional regulator AlpA